MTNNYQDIGKSTRREYKGNHQDLQITKDVLICQRLILHLCNPQLDFPRGRSHAPPDRCPGWHTLRLRRSWRLRWGTIAAVTIPISAAIVVAACHVRIVAWWWLGRAAVAPRLLLPPGFGPLAEKVLADVHGVVKLSFAVKMRVTGV